NGVVKGVVPQGDDWILIFNQFADRYDWYRVNRSGVVLSRTFFAGPGSVSPTQIAGNGSGTMLVYVAGALFANFDREVSVKALFLNKDGFPASDWTIGKVTLKSTVDLAATRPSVTWDGQSFVVVWRDLSAGFENSLRVTRIDPDVFQLPPSVAVDGAIPNDSKSSKPTVSGSSKGLLVAWEIDAAKSTTETDILVHVAPAVETMRVSLSQLVSSAPVNEQNVRGAVDRNGGMFTVWRERGTVGRIGGALTRPDGTQSPRRAISANVVSAEFPVVAWNDGVYLVAWREDDPPSGSSRDTFAVMGRRYNERGEALDAAPFPIAVQLIDPRPDPLARHIAIASNGKNFLVAWIVLGQDVHAARVRTDGTVLDPFPIEIATASSLAYEPGILVDGDTYVVWWSELQDALTRVTGAAVSNGGTVVENPHAYFVRTLPDGLRTSTFRTIPFHVASNGTEALTTWKRLGASNNATCIYATRTNLQGLPAFSPEKQVACFTTQFSTMNEPRAVWDGKQWWVVYYTPVTLELVAVPLDSNINPAGPAMVITPATDQTEALALTTPHGAAILYNRIDPASHYVRRAFARNIVINARSRAAEH
ncbi:MAG TPA: hypothetical protein VMU84_19295, partial [Thermoanaerobaculia bacterium]|nr:hypothetical protein [Thermoanaerobaculia bacterium]